MTAHVTPEHDARDRYADHQYEDLLTKVLHVGALKGDRTGTGTYSLFGQSLRYDLHAGFPLVTTKRVHLRSVVVELLWMLRGDTNVGWLHEHGVTIWDEWADEAGDLGPVYGAQWRAWPGRDGQPIDQIAALVRSLRENPDSRRHIVTAWNPADVDRMALPPCHAFVQFDVTAGLLSCHVYQRSADLFLGVPFNLASYALLTHLLARESGLEVGDLVWTGGDCHIYLNHVEQVARQIDRVPFAFPTLHVEHPDLSMFALHPADVSVDDYRHHPGIAAPVAV